MKYGDLRDGAPLAPDEPYFVLRGQDVLAPHAVQVYAALLRAAAAGAQELDDRDHGVPVMERQLCHDLREQAEDAERIAAQMVVWQARNRVKLPD
jgi:hypothetical protein